MKCQNCGAESEESVCEHCGTRLRKETKWEKWKNNSHNLSDETQKNITFFILFLILFASFLAFVTSFFWVDLSEEFGIPIFFGVFFIVFLTVTIIAYYKESNKNK